MTTNQKVFIIVGLLLSAATLWAAWGSVGSKRREGRQ